MAGEGARQAGAGPFGQMAASAAVGMGLPVAGMVLSGGIRAALAGSAARRAAAKQTMDLIQAGDPNAAVTLGQVAEGGAARTIEGGLRNIPGSGRVFQKTLEKQAEEMGKRVEKTASKLGPSAHREVIGARAQGAIEEGFIPNFKAKAEELYKRVYSLVPETAPVTPTSSTILMAKQNDIMGMARELSDDITNPKFASILEHLGQAAESGGGTVPFGVMKELRSRLGAMLSGDELVAEINLRDVKRLYQALTEDMATAVQKQGGAAATNAWNRANAFTRTGHDRIEKVLQPLISQKKPEQAFTALMSGTKEGATALRSGGSAGGAVGAAAGAVGSVVAAHQLAERVFTSPKAISWLLRQTKVPYGAMRQELAILAKDSQKWGPADRDVGMELASTLSQMDWRTILMGGAAADATSVRR
jgi:hypothetical protein